MRCHSHKDDRRNVTWVLIRTSYVCFIFWQFDLRSSEKEKERLSAEVQRLQVLNHNMDDLKRQSQELCSRLSQQETQHNSENEDLRVGTKTKRPNLSAPNSSGLTVLPRILLFRCSVRLWPPSFRTLR